MNESSTSTTKTFTGSASLAALGLKRRERKLFEPIEQSVQIAQKTVKDRPSDKLYDAWISPAFRSARTGRDQDAAASRCRLAAGCSRRQRCAEQSVVQDTLNACTAENVGQMEQAMDM